MPAPAPEIIDVNGEKKSVPVILPASVYNSRTGYVPELPAVYVPECKCVPVPVPVHVVPVHVLPVLPVYVPKCVPVPVWHQYRYRTLR